MARPKTHGAPISFRLPLAYAELLERRASEHGESAPEYVRRNIMRTLGRPNGDAVEAPVEESQTA